MKRRRLPPKKSRQSRNWQVKNKLMQKAFARTRKIERMTPVERANIEAFLEKMGMQKSIEELSRELLAFSQNLQNERLGQEKRFAIRATEEADFLREIRAFLYLMDTAKAFRLL